MSRTNSGASLQSNAQKSNLTFMQRQAASFKGRFPKRVAKLFVYLLLVCISFVCLFPLLYILVTSVMSNSDLNNASVNWIPTRLQFENFYIAHDLLNYSRFLRNSVTVTSLATLGHIISCSFIGYGFARFKFPFKKILFFLVILSFLVPVQTIIIPSYITYVNLGWINTYRPLIVPTFFGFGLNGALYIFIFRQFFLTLPTDLENAAKIDGCGFIQTYMRIVFPLTRSAVVVVFIFSLVWHWNNFYEPGIYLRSSLMGFLPNSINRIIAIVNAPPEILFEMLGLIEDGEDTLTNAVVMAGTLLVIAPVLVIFAFAQRAFMQGIERSGITGE